ncbi:alpha/beta fold hydrolase [Paraburkholderia sp. 2C]|jgi:homoserine O-acetyltransferase/O-succinyltransferase
MPDFETFNLGRVTLQSGATLPDMLLGYKTYGRLNAARDNAIVYPTFYSGSHADNEWLIGEHMGLDPLEYFIIVPNMFGNGVSSSPSNNPPPYDRGRFPHVTLYDNVAMQHRLVTEKFGIASLRLVTGWSMGAMQAYHWAAMYPEMVERLLPICGSARCSRHNFVFIEGLKAPLLLDPAFKHGFYDAPPTRGMRAAARVFAGWGFSQAFLRQRLDIEAMGYGSLEDFITHFWEGDFLKKDANNILSMMWSWQHGDISANSRYMGDFDRALGSITAKAMVMPGRTDLYFPPEDSAYEVSKMPNAQLRPIESVWGHFAGGPAANATDIKFIDRAVRDILAM